MIGDASAGEESAAETYPSGIPKPPLQEVRGDTEVMIVTGMSGAGRTRVAASLGDLGWFVVDNLPPQLLGGLVAMIGRNPGDKLAAVVDVRGREFFQDVEFVVDELRARGVRVSLLFLDASDAALVRRFEEARRPHPLQEDGTLLEGITRERGVLAALRARADHVVDTSDLNVYELRDRIVALVGHRDEGLQINVMSFGFKNGVPADVDFVADVRFLNNPHWVTELRPLTGLDPAVREFVMASDGAREFLESYARVLDLALSRYAAHDKHSVTIGIGCTGGKHRSVTVAEELSRLLEAPGRAVRLTHRDMERS